MKPKTILVVCVVYLAFVMFCTLVFLFLPSVLDGHDYWGRFTFASLVMLLVWLSVKIIQQKRLAWYMGAIVFGPLALSGLLAIPMYIMQSFGRVDPREAMPLWGGLLCVAYSFAFVMLFAHRGVRGLFRTPQVGGGAETTTDDTRIPGNEK